MATTISGGSGPQVFVGTESGLTVVAPATPLTRLNYYDGKFLRADDLDVEQEYFRQLSQLSNVAGGSGVVHGFDVDAAAGDTLALSPGLALDPSGRVLLLPQGVTLDVQTLIDQTERLRVLLLQRSAAGTGEFSDCIAQGVATAPPSTVTVAETGFYLITIALAEALCGEDYVFGTLCEEACATDVQRPRRLDGIAVRAWPFTPRSALPTSGAVTLTALHLRSRLASARFADETTDFASLLDLADLSSTVWCHGACAPGPGDVPLAVLARSGAATQFVDVWTARRELLEMPPRRYWAGRMGMRPLAVFLAQVLQFQCQLRDVLPAAAPFHHLVLNQAVVSKLLRATDERMLRDAVDEVRLQAPTALRPATTRVLIDAGIVELPSAGYLPVSLDGTVNDQVRRLVGEGVELTFCVVRPDYVPHALEEAQHMQRISLLAGLDDPGAKPDVEILVPDGEIVRAAPKTAGAGWEARLQLTPVVGATTAEMSAFAGAKAVSTDPAPGLAVHGAGRSELLPTGGARFHLAAATDAQLTKLTDLVRGWSAVATPEASDFHLLAEVAKTHAKSTPQTTVGDTGMTRILRVASAADAYTRNVETAGAEAPVASSFTAALDRGTHVVALWATLGCDRDPFSLRLGEAASVQLTADLVLPSTRSTVATYDLRGDLRIDRILPSSGGIRRVSGLLSGLGSTTLHVGAQATQHGGAFRRRVTLVFAEPASAAPTFDVFVAAEDGRGVGFDVRVTWDGSPLVAQVALQLVHLERQVSVPLGTFAANPDVLLTGNQVNTLARSALQIVGAALADTGFVDAAQALLFPPPEQPVSELTVKPHRNWVLFRRARTKQCAPEQQAVELPNRQVDVWELAANDANLVAVVRRAVLEGDASIFKKLPPRFVERVAFAGGAATLVTPATELRGKWQAVRPQKLVAAAFVADTVGDGDLLARSRAVALEQALGSDVDDQATVETLAQVPQPLVRPGADGTILVVTRRPDVQTTCMTVFRVNPEFADRFRGVLGDDPAVVQAMLAALNPAAGAAPALQLVGQGLFPVGGAELVPQSVADLKAAWVKFAELPPDGDVFVFARQGDPAVEPAQLAPRGLQVVQAMGSGDGKATVRTVVKPALPGPCPAAVVAFVELPT